jgi:hypothetical protein
MYRAHPDGLLDDLSVGPGRDVLDVRRRFVPLRAGPVDVHPDLRGRRPRGVRRTELTAVKTLREMGVFSVSSATHATTHDPTHLLRCRVEGNGPRRLG